MKPEAMSPEESVLVKDMLDNPGRYPPVSLVSKLCDADILVVSGPMNEAVSRQVVKTIKRSKEIRSRNMCLILCTFGGEAEPAYKIARTIRRYYDTFTLYVFGYCKSAGTIVALGADEIVFGDDGELGPLDVQVTKENGLGQMQSGLEYASAMKAVSSSAFDVFEEHFLGTFIKSKGTISLKTCIEAAANIAIGLVSPISAQLDPLRMGEIRRAVDIAFEYGVKLGADPDLVRFLIDNYPSHEYMIDYEEAKFLFPKTRMLDWDAALETALSETLEELGFPNSIYFPDKNGVVQFIEENTEVSYTESGTDDLDLDLAVEDVTNPKGGNNELPVTKDEE